MSQTSLALRNMHGYLILIVVAFHSSLAYLTSNPAEQPLFFAPPYAWKGTPIIDSDRWIGFDLFVAWQYVYMMQLPVRICRRLVRCRRTPSRYRA
jgi:hypothetical protein